MRFGNKSRATHRALTHQISSWSKEKWQRYGTWAISQGRRGPSNGVSKMNLFMAGGHSFWLRKLIFGYVVAQCIYPKSYYYPLLIKSLVWSPQGSKDDHFGPKYRDRLYTIHFSHWSSIFTWFIRSAKSSQDFLLYKEVYFCCQQARSQGREVLAQ